MQAEGTFDYKLDFKFNQNKPDQLVFDSNLKKEKLKITKYGEANLTKLEFVYRAIIKDVLQRPILVGASKLHADRPNFPYLRKMCFNYRRPFFFPIMGL
jgi:hypothetical protein